MRSILPKTKTLIILHIPDTSDISTKFRPGAAVGFAEDSRDCTDENGKPYVKYIKANAAKLAGLTIEHPALFYLIAHYGQARQGCFDHQQREEIRGIVREELAASLLRCAEQTPAETLKDENAPDETDLDNLLDMMGS